MAQKMQVPLPEDVVIGDGWQLVWDAVDPTTGASVAGVVITEANITADDASAGGVVTVETGPYMLIPGPGA